MVVTCDGNCCLAGEGVHSSLLTILLSVAKTISATRWLPPPCCKRSSPLLEPWLCWAAAATRSVLIPLQSRCNAWCQVHLVRLRELLFRLKFLVMSLVEFYPTHLWLECDCLFGRPRFALKKEKELIFVAFSSSGLLIREPKHRAGLTEEEKLQLGFFWCSMYHARVSHCQQSWGSLYCCQTWMLVLYRVIISCWDLISSTVSCNSYL